MARSVEGTIGIKDNFTGAMTKIRSAVKEMREETEKTGEVMSNTWSKEYEVKLDTEGATSKAKEMQGQLNKLDDSESTPTVSLKDRATEKIRSIFEKSSELGKKVFTIGFKVAGTGAELLKGAAGAFKTMTLAAALPLLLVASGAGAFAGFAYKEGMAAQTNTTRIRQYVEAGNPKNSVAKNMDLAAAYNKDLRGFAAGSRLFDYSEIMDVGADALSMAGGDGKTAMSYLKAAQDMAALSPGKTLQNAMDALRSAKNGKAGALDDFGIDISGETLKDIGIEGLLSDYITPLLGGGTRKMENTTKGLLLGMRNMTRNALSMVGESAVTNLEPTLQKAYTIMGGIMPKLAQVGISATNMVGDGVNWAVTQLEANGPRISGFIDKLVGIGTTLAPMYKTMGETLLDLGIKAAPLIDGIVDLVGIAATHLGPLFGEIYKGLGEKIGGVFKFLADEMPYLKQVFSDVMPGVTELVRGLWSIMSPMIDGTISGFKQIYTIAKWAWPGISKALQTAWGVIKPILSGMALMIQQVADGLAGITGSKITGKGTGAGVWGNSGLVYSASTGGEGIGSNASGTDNWRGGLTYVGERGPELVYLPRGTQIIPHGESTQMLGGGRRGSTTVVVSRFADTIIVQQQSDIDALGASFAKHIKDAWDNLADSGDEEAVPA